MSKPGVKLARAEASDVLHIVHNLRDEDAAEVAASHGRNAESLILRAVEQHETTVARCYGEPIAMWGVVPGPILVGGGVPWLLGTDKIVEHQVQLLRESRPWVQDALAEYKYLENYVDDRNETSKRWLKWLGFEFDEPEKYGVENRLFRRFYTGEL